MTVTFSFNFRASTGKWCLGLLLAVDEAGELKSSAEASGNSLEEDVVEDEALELKMCDLNPCLDAIVKIK